MLDTNFTPTQPMTSDDSNSNQTNISNTSLRSPVFPTWCPGCGDFGIWGAIKQALAELNIPEEKLVISFDIGCSGNMADFLRVYGFHALHGRTVPIAEGIKLANHGLKVLVIGGDGGLYGEGMGHLIASCRGNHNIAMLVHNNQVYGLTTGQAAPTAAKGTKTKSTPQGVIENPVNPIALALAANGSFIARSYAGDIAYTKNLIKKAILHPGFALLDIFQPCITFNKTNTHAWFQERVYKLETINHDVTNKTAAWELSQQTDKLPIGLFYEDATLPAYHQQIANLTEKPIVDQFSFQVDLAEVLKKMT